MTTKRIQEQIQMMYAERYRLRCEMECTKLGINKSDLRVRIRQLTRKILDLRMDL